MSLYASSRKIAANRCDSRKLAVLSQLQSDRKLTRVSQFQCQTIGGASKQPGRQCWHLRGLGVGRHSTTGCNTFSQPTCSVWQVSTDECANVNDNVSARSRRSLRPLESCEDVLHRGHPLPPQLLDHKINFAVFHTHLHDAYLRTQNGWEAPRASCWRFLIASQDSRSLKRLRRSERQNRPRASRWSRCDRLQGLLARALVGSSMLQLCKEADCARRDAFPRPPRAPGCALRLHPSPAPSYASPRARALQ